MPDSGRLIAAPTPTRHQSRRHCERSEAIRLPETASVQHKETDCFVAKAPRNDSLFYVFAPPETALCRTRGRLPAGCRGGVSPLATNATMPARSGRETRPLRKTYRRRRVGKAYMRCAPAYSRRCRRGRNLPPVLCCAMPMPDSGRLIAAPTPHSVNPSVIASAAKQSASPKRRRCSTRKRIASSLKLLAMTVCFMYSRRRKRHFAERSGGHARPYKRQYVGIFPNACRCGHRPLRKTRWRHPVGNATMRSAGKPTVKLPSAFAIAHFRRHAGAG